MRILFFIYDLGIGGAEKNTVQLSNYLASKGYQVTILTLYNLNLLENNISKNINLYSLNSKKLLGSFKKIFSFLKKNPADVMFVNVWPLTAIALLAGIFFRIKIVPIEHGILSKEFKPRGKIFCWLQNITILITYNFFSCHVLTVSEAAKKDLNKKGVLSNKISVIYNSFDEYNETHKNISFPEWTEHAGPRLISIANLKSEKNLFNLLEAFKKVKDNINANPRLLIIGSGPQEKELKCLAKDLEIDNDVTFAGMVIEPLSYLEKSNLFILSSDFEAFGIVILEAMSLGKTIVSTESEGPKEIINHPSVGYLCKVGDSDDLAKNIIQALKNPLKENVVIKRSKDFSIEKIGMAYEELIKKIVN